MNQRELHDATAPRDARSVAATEVRTTDIESAVQWLEADAAAGVITDNLVWLSRTGGPANVEQVVGHYVSGGERDAPGWRSVFVELAYLARGQLHKLSVYCGIASRDGGMGERTLLTAQRVQETERRLQTVLARLRQDHGLEARGGGALHLHDLAPWLAHPDDSITAAAPITCAVCGEVIHYSNGQWRDGSGRYEVGKSVPCNRCINGQTRGRQCQVCHGSGTRQQFDHVHGTEVSS